MANNVPMKDAGDDTRVFATIEIDGVHYVRHIAVSEASLRDVEALATALTSGSSAALEVGLTGSSDLRPGLYQFTAWGTPDGSTLKIQFSPNSGTTWIDTDVRDIPENSVIGIHLAVGLYRATVVDAGASTSWNADFRGVA